VKSSSGKAMRRDSGFVSAILGRSEKEGGGLVRIPPPGEPPGSSPASSNSGKVACRARIEKEDGNMSPRSEKTDLHAPVSFCTLWRSEPDSHGNYSEVTGGYDFGRDRWHIEYTYHTNFFKRLSGAENSSTGVISGSAARNPLHD